MDGKRSHRAGQDPIRAGRTAERPSTAKRSKRRPWDGVPEERRRIMAANRRRDTGIERAVRSRLHAEGLRFRVDLPVRPQGAVRPIRPDVVFPKHRIAVFIDGCFWHGCPEHGTLPETTNVDYWTAKIAENRARDARHDSELAAGGWAVVRAWEHEDPGAVARRVASLVRVRSEKPGPCAD